MRPHAEQLPVDQRHRVLDQAARDSLRLGPPLRRVATNLDPMLAPRPAGAGPVSTDVGSSHHVS